MTIAHKKTFLILISGLVLIAIVVLNLDIKKEKFTIPDTVDFNFNVRPILVQKCYLCHGPDGSSRKGGLRLDTYEGATALLKTGNRAINIDHPDVSELISRIHDKDPEVMMPPPDSKMLLTEQEKAILTKWIKQGAHWKPHWAFIMPDSSVNEKVKSYSGNPIDFFVDSKLDENGLKPSTQAEKSSLIRRASYLLTGLPPSIKEMEDFTADKSDGAYEKMIDHYLNSTSFGECWARHWMDLARYAETKGHEFDFAVSGAWRYRDYLIRAFNNDVGYDQLVKEQLAGDLIENPRRDPITGANESRLGTMFLTMTEGVHSPVDIRQDEADRIDNMIDVTTKSFQALTVTCARCHDHKFDPIPTSDYYSLFGVMESTRFSPVSATVNNNDKEKIIDFQKSNAELRKKIAEIWEANKKTSLATSIYFHTTNPSHDTAYTMIGDFRNNNLDGWKTDGLAFGNTLGNPIFDQQGKKLLYLDEGKASSRINGTKIFGILRSPNFTITTDSILVRAIGKDATVRLIIDNFQLIQDPIYGGNIRRLNDGKWQDVVINTSSWKGHNAFLEIMPGVFDQHVYQLPADAYVDALYAISFNGKKPVIKQENQPLTNDNLTLAIQRWKTNQCSADDVKLLNQNLKKGFLQKEHLSIENLIKVADTSAVNQPDNKSFYNGIYDGFAINSPVFVRGSYKATSANRIPRHFLSVLKVGDSVFTNTGSGRLELVESILSPKNPLTARVMVNRIWHYLFGKGIVETVDNFGLQGKLPSNLELLDYLAIRFQKDNWSIKKMIRLIVTSKTFQRAVEANENAQKKDPGNIYLSHFPIRRLEAEAIRDGLLYASGRLDTAMYGTPVPVYLTEFMEGRGRPEKSGPIDGAGRRSIYQEVRRNFLDPMMMAFDRPIPFSTFGNRNVTNVPAQSLFMMNDSFVTVQAGLMAEKLIKQKNKTEDERIQFAYETVFARLPSEEEIKKGKEFLQTLAQVYKADPKNIMENENIWKDYCHSLFNMKEFIFLI